MVLPLPLNQKFILWGVKFYNSHYNVEIICSNPQIVQMKHEKCIINKTWQPLSLYKQIQTTPGNKRAKLATRKMSI